MRYLSRAILMLSLLLSGLMACQSTPPEQIPPSVIPPPAQTATPFPTPVAVFSGEELEERIALIDQFPPQAGVAAYNRVEALIMTHDFVQAYLHALEDDYIDQRELEGLLRLAANARASLYNTGQPDMIQFANTAGWLLDLAIFGDWETATKGIRTFQRSLPRKPSLD